MPSGLLPFMGLPGFLGDDCVVLWKLATYPCHRTQDLDFPRDLLRRRCEIPVTVDGHFEGVSRIRFENEVVRTRLERIRPVVLVQ